MVASIRFSLLLLLVASASINAFPGPVRIHHQEGHTDDLVYTTAAPEHSGLLGVLSNVAGKIKERAVFAKDAVFGGVGILANKTAHALVGNVERPEEVKDAVVDSAINLKNKTVEKVEDVKEAAKDAKDVVVGGAAVVANKTAHAVEKGVEKIGDAKDAVVDSAINAKNKVVEKAEDVKDGVVYAKDVALGGVGILANKTANALEGSIEKAEDAKDAVADRANKLKNKTAEKVEDVKEAASEAGEKIKAGAKDAKDAVVDSALDIDLKKLTYTIVLVKNLFDQFQSLLSTYSTPSIFTERVLIVLIGMIGSVILGCLTLCGIWIKVKNSRPTFTLAKDNVERLKNLSIKHTKLLQMIQKRKKFQQADSYGQDRKPDKYKQEQYCFPQEKK